MVTFWATFETFGLLLIPISGYTGPTKNVHLSKDRMTFS